MTRGFAFWLLLLLVVIFGVFANWPGAHGFNYYGGGFSLVLIILLGLLGWQVFGPPIRG